MPVLQRVTGALNRVSGDAAIASPGGGYTQSPWTANGTNYWLANSAITLGLTTGDAFTFAAFVQGSFVNTNRYAFAIGQTTASTNKGLGVRFSASAGEFQPNIYDSAGTSRNITSGTVNLDTSTLYLLVVSCDTSGTQAQMGVSAAGTLVDTGTVGMTTGTRWTGIYSEDQTIGADITGANGMQNTNTIADVWFANAYHQANLQATHDLFWSGSVPKNPGADGSGYTGTQPLIFCGGANYDWSGATISNLGSAGGSFTLT